MLVRMLAAHNHVQGRHGHPSACSACRGRQQINQLTQRARLRISIVGAPSLATARANGSHGPRCRCLQTHSTLRALPHAVVPEQAKTKPTTPANRGVERHEQSPQQQCLRHHLGSTPPTRTPTPCTRAQPSDLPHVRAPDAPQNAPSRQNSAHCSPSSTNSETAECTHHSCPGPCMERRRWNAAAAAPAREGASANANSAPRFPNKQNRLLPHARASAGTACPQQHRPQPLAGPRLPLKVGAALRGRISISSDHRRSRGRHQHATASSSRWHMRAPSNQACVWRLQRRLVGASAAQRAAQERCLIQSKAGFLRSAKRTTRPPQPSCFTRAG